MHSIARHFGFFLIFLFFLCVKQGIFFALLGFWHPLLKVNVEIIDE